MDSRGSGQGRAAGNADDSKKLDTPKTERRTRQRDKRSKRQVMRKMMSTLLIVFLVGGGYAFGKGYLNILNVFRGGGNALALDENVHPSRLRGEGDGRVNVLLLGRGGDGHNGADLTDTIIVASIDPVNNKAALLGIPRDLYVQPEGYGAMKVNAVYSTGKNYNVREGEDPNDAGLRLLEKTLQDSLGIPIHYNATIDFEGFKQAVDTVGGVTVDVPEDLAVFDYMHYFGTPYTLDVDPGKQKFDGLRALMYSRTRAIGSDFERSKRQRLMMIALKDRVFSLGTYGNPVKVNELLGDLGNSVTTNFTTEEIMRVYEIMQEVPSDQIASVGLADEPQRLVTTANFGGESVVIPTAGNLQFDDIRYFVRNTLRDGFLEKENASVDVYNGTLVTGLAGRTAEHLKSFGYNVGTVADAPTKGMQNTIVVDMTGGKKEYTKKYLENRFGVSAVNNLPGNDIDPGNADFVIILGTNEERRLQN